MPSESRTDLVQVSRSSRNLVQRSTSLFLMATRLKRMTLRIITTENMNMGKTAATAILRQLTAPMAQQIFEAQREKLADASRRMGNFCTCSASASLPGSSTHPQRSPPRIDGCTADPAHHHFLRLLTNHREGVIQEFSIKINCSTTSPCQNIAKNTANKGCPPPARYTRRLCTAAGRAAAVI